MTTQPVGPAFEILLAGRFELEEVQVTWRPHAVRRPDAAVDAMIAASWARRLASATDADRWLFPGPLCRLTSWAITNSRLHLAFGPTDYRDFLGTNVDNLAAIRDAHPSDWRALLANPLGVCAAMVSADGWLLVVERGEHIAEYPSCYSVVGGHPTPAHDDGVGGVSPFLALQEEIVEETGIRPTEIATLTCLGLARVLATAKPELLFEARLALPRATVEARLRARHGPTEDHAWLWLNDEPAALHAFLTRFAARVAPAGAACLTVYGRRPR